MTTFRSELNAPSETKFERLAIRIGQWAMRRNLNRKDVDLILEVIETLRAADDALCAAGFFASAVAEPNSLRFVWSAGQQPFDPQAALQQLKNSADYIMWAVDTELFGANPAMPPPPKPPDRFYYRVSSHEAKVKIESPVPMYVDEICKIVLRRFLQAGLPFGDILEVSHCDEKYVARDTVSVSSKDQLQKAGLRSTERGTV